MSAAWDKRRIAELRQWYGDRAKEHLGRHFKADMSIPVTAASWLVRKVVEMKPRRIVEFGAGFSTLVFARALHALPELELISLDHDSSWLAFARSCAEDKGARMDRIVSMTTHQFLAFHHDEPYDLAFVDHGPSYDARIATIAPILGSAARSGCRVVVLDDWHKASRRHALYVTPVTDIVRSLELTVEGIPESSAPSDARQLARIVLRE